MASLSQLRPVSDLPFTLSFPQSHGTARRLFPLLDGSTEPVVKENQGQTTGEALELEAAQQTPGEMVSRRVCHGGLCQQVQLSGMT